MHYCGWVYNSKLKNYVGNLLKNYCRRKQWNYNFFFDIVELQSAILKNLSSNGMDDNFLKQNLIAFVSDGASSMLGRV